MSLHAPCVRRVPHGGWPRPSLRGLLRYSLCSLLGMLLVLVLLIALLFCRQRALLELLLASAQPLGDLLRWLPPAGLWDLLTGVPAASSHPALRSALGLLACIGQYGLLAGWGLYRLWYREDD